MTTTPHPTRRDVLKAMGVGVLALPRLMRTALGDTPDRPPNIVLIMADDMGFSDLGCYGGEIRMPTLNRLAAGGLRFTQFYNTARCCPTRASLLTGLYSHQAGVGHMESDRGQPGYTGRLNSSCVTIAEVLRGAGYRTMMVGKWHVSRFNYETNTAKDREAWPLQRGFDQFYGTLSGGGSYFYPHGLFRDNMPIAEIPEEYYLTDAISNEAARLIQQAAPEDRPFFLYVAYTAPHWPLHALAADINRYAQEYKIGWDALRQRRLARLVAEGIVRPEWKLTPRDKHVPPWNEADNQDWHAHNMAVYAAQIDRMDQGIGRIVAALEHAGELGNTLLVFLSDNGGCAEVLREQWGGKGRRAFMQGALPNGAAIRFGNNPEVKTGGPETFASYGVGWANASNTPFRLYKHWVHEGGIATPLIVHWPAGITARGELRHQPGHVIDIMATCVEVAGAEYPTSHEGQPITPLEGISLVPAFRDAPLRREALYWEHEGNRAVRMGKWKLVAKGREGKWELFDLEADRTETRDLAAEHPERVTEMAESWQRWAERAHVLPCPW